MKRILILAVLAVVSVVMLMPASKGDAVRIHIRANSDSESDQAVKIQVRDRVNEYLYPLLENVKTRNEAISVLEGAEARLKEIAEEASEMECTVSLREEVFPEKTYNGETFPEGEYTALIIEIGEGAGRNWWCVAYPNMCYTTSEKIEYRSFIVELLERIGLW